MIYCHSKFIWSKLLGYATTMLSHWYVWAVPLYVRVGVRGDLMVASFEICDEMYVIKCDGTSQPPSSPSPFGA